jgi:AraC family transcriptional regulator
MRTTTFEDYRQRVLEVLVYIQKHLDRPLALDELARVAHFSPFHFHRIFRGMVGESVKEYIRRLRLERAAHRLRYWEQSVTVIAIDAGYEAHESFTRAFRGMFGKSPLEYRQTYRTLREPSPREYEDSLRESPEINQVTISGAEAVEVVVKRINPMRVAFVRHVGPYADCGPAWEKVCRWAAETREYGPDTLCIGISYDDPDVTPPDKIRYDACLTVGAGVTPSGDVAIQEIPGGEYAVVTHQGPYHELSKTYAALFRQWVPASGRELRSAPCLEIYRNDPSTTPPEQLLTDIYLPLES